VAKTAGTNIIPSAGPSWWRLSRAQQASISDNKTPFIAGWRANFPTCFDFPTLLIIISTSLFTLWAVASVFATEVVQATPPQALTSQQQREREENRQREAEERKRLTELYLRNQSVFIRKGELMLELNTLYERNSQQNVVPVIGGFALIPTTRRFVENILIARYGLLTDGLELDLIAPVFVYGEQTSDFGATQTTTKNEGVGDIGGALRYEAWYERGIRPSLVLDVEGKSQTGGSGLTGTGTWSVGGGVTLIKTIDPVVFFGRVGYIYNFPSQSRELGSIVEYRLGMGYSLNDRVSFNIQLTGAYIGPSQVSGIGISGTTGGPAPIVFSTHHIEIMNLFFTTTVLVTKNFFIEPLVGVALTDQSFTIVGLRVPYRF